MTTDIRTVIWKELKESLAHQSGAGGGTAGVRQLMVMTIAFGVFIPLSAGPSWTGLPAISLAAAMAGLAVITTVPDSFAGERDRKTLETLLTSRLSDRSILLGKLAAAALIGLGAAILLLAVSVITVNLSSHHGGLIFYTLLELAAALGAAALVGILLANVGVLASLRAPSAMAAQRAMGLGMAVLVGGSAAAVSALPQGWKTDLARVADKVGTESPAVLVAVAVAVLLVLNWVVFSIAVSLFRRPKLIRA